MKNITGLLLIGFLTFTVAVPSAFADAAVGDKMVTLGANLSLEQKTRILQEMEVKEGEVDILTVTHAEEVQYLGDYIPRSKIGSKSFSSAKITLEKKGTGLDIETHNVNWVTEDMYRNALITAGVSDASIYITAPFEVSGTAALTGILKAYEQSTNVKIDEEVKQVANEEMVRTAELAEKVGADLAADLMNRVKEELAKQTIENEDVMRALIEQRANEMGLSLTDSELDKLVTMFMKMQNADINWDEVQDNIETAKEKVSEFVNSEEGQTFIQNVKDVMISIIDWIVGLFETTEPSTK